MSQANRQPYSSRQMIIFVIVCLVIIFGYTQIENWINPKPKVLTPQQQAEIKNNLPHLMTNVPQGDGYDAFRLATSEIARSLPDDAKKKSQEWAKAEQKKAEPPKPKPKAPEVKPDFVALGDSQYFLQARLTTKGAGVDQLLLTHFPASQFDKSGREVLSKGPDGKPLPLKLIVSPDDLTEEQRQELSHDELLPSFLLYHYSRPNEERPENTLGEANWELVNRDAFQKTNQGERAIWTPKETRDVQEVSFETKLPEFGLKIVKTYTLQKGHYHLGLKVRFERLPGTNTAPFRYQLAGGHGLPIEGHWYTSVYRNAIFGYLDGNSPARHLEDARSIHHNSGSEKFTKTSDRRFQYAATAIQYFASAICIDDEQPNANFVEAVRATAEGVKKKEQQMFGDICPRMISEPLTVEKEAEHRYLLYHGPVKVRLLSQMHGEGNVAEALVERYEKTLNLRTMTDYRSDTWLGKFANFIFWTDLVIASTNFMHWLFGLLTSFMPPWLAILALTVIVRGILMPVSRWQTAKQMAMTEKMKKLNPELKKLEEEYRGRDPQELHQAKMKLMMEHGINPLSSLGGCLPVLAQMPIFMGLYYCLQENVFFRLESFLWIPNLAAPDMLFRWGDWMKALGVGIGDMLYLGPFFNLLPVITVTLYIIQQKYMMPPAADEQQKFQQGMMKYMMIFVGVMFYKVAAGLCMYFIFSTLWGLAERKLIPKPKLKPEDELPKKGDKKKGGATPKSKLQLWLEKILEEAQKKNR